MKKAFILNILLICLIRFINAQDSVMAAHEYSIFGEFIEIKITDNKIVELYIYPYDDYLFSGECIKSNDTLSLTLKAKNDSIAKRYSNPRYQAILTIVSEHLMVGEYLIPTKLVVDSTCFGGLYLFNPLGFWYSLRFEKDSTFKYRHGASTTSGGTHGKWIINNQQIILKPHNEKNVLHWICSDYKFVICKNWIVGTRNYKGIKTFRYLKKE